MAKEKKEIPTWIRVGVGIVGSVALIWATAWGVGRAVGKTSASEGFLLASHETRITHVEDDVDALDTRMDNTEKMQLTIQADQRAILNNQGDFKKQLHEQSRLQIEQIKVNAELNAYLRTIDKIE